MKSLNKGLLDSVVYQDRAKKTPMTEGSEDMTGRCVLKQIIDLPWDKLDRSNSRRLEVVYKELNSGGHELEDADYELLKTKVNDSKITNKFVFDHVMGIIYSEDS